jgi:hypothetical protein
MSLTRFAIYVGIGALCHAVFIGTQFDWSSAWTFAWVFAWPLMLFAKLVVYFVAFLVICFVTGCVVLVVEAIHMNASEETTRRTKRR